MSVAILLLGVTICLLVVALHKRRKSFEDAAKWTGLSASKTQGKGECQVFLCDSVTLCLPGKLAFVPECMKLP